MNRKIIFITLALAIGSCGYAQNPLSKMGAKAKAKAAKKEEKEAAKDLEYQRLMDEGISYFEENRFEEALSRFELAMNRRPINVYPPVMIEDVKLAMENYVPPVEEDSMDEMMASENEIIPEPVSEEVEVEEEIENQKVRVEEAFQKELEKIEETAPPPPIEPEVVESAKKELEAVAVDDEAVIEYTDEHPQVEMAAELPDGITETEFKEGNKTVLRRVVVKDGIANDYRKVTHQWGGVFYFKNGESITLRTWEQETALE